MEAGREKAGEWAEPVGFSSYYAVDAAFKRNELSSFQRLSDVDLQNEVFCFK